MALSLVQFDRATCENLMSSPVPIPAPAPAPSTHSKAIPIPKPLSLPITICIYIPCPSRIQVPSLTHITHSDLALPWAWRMWSLLGGCVHGFSSHLVASTSTIRSIGFFLFYSILFLYFPFLCRKVRLLYCLLLASRRLRAPSCQRANTFRLRIGAHRCLGSTLDPYFHWPKAKLDQNPARRWLAFSRCRLSKLAGVFGFIFNKTDVIYWCTFVVYCC